MEEKGKDDGKPGPLPLVETSNSSGLLKANYILPRMWFAISIPSGMGNFAFIFFHFCAK